MDGMRKEVTDEMIDAIALPVMRERFWNWLYPSVPVRNQLPKHYQTKEKQNVKEPER